MAELGAKKLAPAVSPRRLLLYTGYFLLAALYLAYLGFVVFKNRGPVDYETFMEIGGRFLAGKEVYGVNSYYPMPYVLVFAAFALLPRWLSLFLWLALPVAAVVIVSEGALWALAFAPVFAHFVGGQSALPGMLGLWGYRRAAGKFSGGLWLALASLKPQLLVFPAAWAAADWIKEWRATRKLPASFTGFIVGVAVLYLPAFLIYPTWPVDWLRNPRALSGRAMEGLLPRALLLLHLPPVIYGLLLVGMAVLLFLAIRKRISFDRYMLWSFIISPLVHDYDLIQIVPILRSSRMKIAAVLLSLPTWWVIASAYSNDAAWFAVTLIAPGLLAFAMHERQTSA